MNYAINTGCSISQKWNIIKDIRQIFLTSKFSVSAYNKCEKRQIIEFDCNFRTCDFLVDIAFINIKVQVPYINFCMNNSINSPESDTVKAEFFHTMATMIV